MSLHRHARVNQQTLASCSPWDRQGMFLIMSHDAKASSALGQCTLRLDSSEGDEGSEQCVQGIEYAKTACLGQALKAVP